MLLRNKSGQYSEQLLIGNIYYLVIFQSLGSLVFLFNFPKKIIAKTNHKPIIKMSDTENTEDKKAVVIRSTIDLQRLKLEKLMKNPEKPIIIPEKPKEKGMPAVPDFVRNVMGSSAGAGSGEFHVYRHLRRKEYARQKYMKEKGEREKLEQEYHNKLEENRKKAEEKTAKKRVKRLKRKQKLKNKRFNTSNKANSKSSEDEEDETDEEEKANVENNLDNKDHCQSSPQNSNELGTKEDQNNIIKEYIEELSEPETEKNKKIIMKDA